MPDPSAGIPTNITAAFEALKEAATDLNTVSDTLATPIEWLDGAIKRLNLGLPAWAEFEGGFDDNTADYWHNEIGYAKIGAKWGIAIRSREGNADQPQFEDSESWLFNDAPRDLRVKAVDHLPKVIEALITEARNTADRIKEKIGQAEEFAKAISGAQPPPPRRK